MRCPDCNKFVSFDTELDPEVDLEVSEDGQTVSAEVRIQNACQECGTELTEATLSPAIEGLTGYSDHIDDLIAQRKKEYEDKADDDHPVPSDKALREEIEADHNPEISDNGAERTVRTEGKGRSTRTFYGVRVFFSVDCTCGDSALDEETLEDEVQASGMEALV